MAKEKKAKPAGKTAAPDKSTKSGRRRRLQIMFGLMAMLVVIWPTACLLVPGMIPTFVCLVTDRDREKALALTVGATNFAGCLPYILQLWITRHTLENALKMMHDPNMWLVMLAAAAIGYLIYIVVPGAVASIMNASAGSKIARIRDTQEQLKKSWGPDVETEKEFNEFGEPVG